MADEWAVTLACFLVSFFFQIATRRELFFFSSWLKLSVSNIYNFFFLSLSLLFLFLLFFLADHIQLYVNLLSAYSDSISAPFLFSFCCCISKSSFRTSPFLFAFLFFFFLALGEHDAENTKNASQYVGFAWYKQK